MQQREVVIVAATRTPVGSFHGALAPLTAVELGAAAVQGLLAQSGVPPQQIDEVILGQVLTAGCGQNPARQTALNAGLPVTTPALTINKVCGSGLKAVHLAVQAIRSGDAEAVIAGGQESMSQSPYLMAGARAGLRLGHAQMVDSVIHDGLWDAFNDYHMGITAENLAEKYAISRAEQDSFALRSQQKALAAQQAGRFAQEITPVTVPQPKGEALRVERDQQPRDTSLEALAKLRPVLDGGLHTAGTSSQISDGAAAVLLLEADRARALGLRP
ncbi:MAG: acetyl-CoA C-acyltransferase, partial [Serratia marcescens]|nr:acetyl-CoA C-acyltransferase [Serratia marcescens]